jgi:hypothetical protein
MKPRFKHDCDRCIFLGAMEIIPLPIESGHLYRKRTKSVEVYFCPGGRGRERTEGSVLLRYCSKPSGYASTCVFAGKALGYETNPDTAKAFDLAINAGLVDTKIAPGSGAKDWSKVCIL